MMVGLALALLGYAGCGCSYGEISAVTVTPTSSCLEAVQGTSCTSLEFQVTNQCVDTLTLSKDGNTLVVEPGETATVDPASFGEVNENKQTCKGTALVRGVLGQTEHQFELTFEMVNRGAGSC